jgi:hypothetical protein
MMKNNTITQYKPNSGCRNRQASFGDNKNLVNTTRGAPNQSLTGLATSP